MSQLKQHSRVSVCVCECLVDCVRLFFARATWFYSISAFYLLVRKNLFTFRIPVSSERWPVLIYQLSSPSCPLALSPPRPSSNRFNILHILHLGNSPTPLHPHTPSWTSSCNSWRHRLSIKERRSRFLLPSATTPSNNGGNGVMLFCVSFLYKQWDWSHTPGSETCPFSSESSCTVLSPPGWRIPPRPRHQMEALLALWAGRVISCQEAWC